MSECPHKQLKKQMVGKQIWYVCECGQKFRVEPWDGRVRLVEGLKVEGRARAFDDSDVWREAMRCDALDDQTQLEQATGAAQHLKREQEGRCTCVVMTPRNIYPGGRHLDDSCPVHTIQPREQEPAPRELRKTIIEELYKRHNGLSPQWIDDFAAFVVRVAAQPPQELASLRELVVEWRKQDDTKDGLCRNIDLCCHGVCADELEAALTCGAVGGTK